MCTVDASTVRSGSDRTCIATLSVSLSRVEGNRKGDAPRASDDGLEVEWAVLADHALVDAGGKLSVIGIFSRLWAAVFPSGHPVLFLVAAWAGQPQRVVIVELRVWGPGGELILSGQQQVQLGPDGKSNGIFQLAPFLLPTPGRFVFELAAEGRSMAHVPLDVAPVPES
jgi:hypothetical protein